jgi:hypothetical protein
MYLINVAKNSLLEHLMLDNLTEDASVSTTNDENFLGAGVGVHGKVGNHFLVPVRIDENQHTLYTFLYLFQGLHTRIRPFRWLE